MVREILRQQQEEMAHSCLEGREENKETELPEAAEMQIGHRLRAHTQNCRHADRVRHPREGTASSLLSAVQGQAGRSGSQSHLSTLASALHFAVRCYWAQSWARFTSSAGAGGNGTLIGCPQAQQGTMGQGPLLAGLLPQHLLTAGCPTGVFHFVAETRPENFKATWEL